jgi:YcaO-like protein with predicted kinase domain
VDTRKQYRAGTDRVTDPTETIARVSPFTDEMGITRIANITGLDRIGVPVVAVCRPNSRSLAVAQGKGVTLDAAKASGLMESVENYHAEHCQGAVLFGSFTELTGRYRLMDLSRLPRLATSGDPARDRRLWIEGESLVDQRRWYVPFELVTTDYRLPLPPGSGSFPMTSNGLASGNHILEAISHGLCELVERDASTLWSHASPMERAASHVDVRTLDDPSCVEVLSKYETASIDVILSETTTDIGIPAFRCAIADRRGSSFRYAPVVSGYGCHPRREIAASRALTEAAQGRLTLISGSRDDISERRYDESAVAHQMDDFQLEKSHGDGKAFQAGPTWASDSLEEDVRWELEQLRSRGLDQAFFVDLTSPRFQIPVCRVIVPGLEAFHEVPGFVPGPRLQRRLDARK